MYNLLVFNAVQENKSPSPHHILKELLDFHWTLFSQHDLVLDLMLLRAVQSYSQAASKIKAFGSQTRLSKSQKRTRASVEN
jgi:hypothetical protein